jgi:hypothetical protein
MAKCKIDYYPFTLESSKSLNHLTPANSARKAAYLRMEHTDGRHSYAEYAPHPQLGDQPLDSFLNDITAGKSQTHFKVWQLLTDDLEYQTPKGLLTFKNHCLISALELDINLKDHSYYKIKIGPNTVLNHPSLKLPAHTRFRLDANGSFNHETYAQFRAGLKPELLPMIEYIEDPLSDLNWSAVDLPLAQDFITPTVGIIAFKIYKPNRDFFSTQNFDHNRIIFSTYQGSWLSDWHAYQELLRYGDLNQVHGLVTSDLSHPSIFESNDYFHYCPCADRIQKNYQALANLSWRNLCFL